MRGCDTWIIKAINLSPTLKL